MTMERVPGNRGNVAVRRWWKRAGKARVQAICDKADISYAHFKHVAAGRRRMSPDSAAVFVRESGAELSLSQLMPPKKAARKTATA